jgi:microcystin degradation protein MlrC
MQHETNTFAPTRADYAAFEAGGGWPGAQYGESLFEAVAGANIPVQGAIEAIKAANHQVVPLAWAAASPSAHVTDDAFERIAGAIVSSLEAALPVDGVYLDLHGAMVTISHDDGEGELLRRVREVIGPRVPMVASLDLHANITRQMVQQSDALSVYRTYPHVDMAETGARAIFMLKRLMAQGKPFTKAYQTFDYLTGIPSQSTFIEPGRSLYALLERIERDTGVHLSFAPGFPMADFEECGMSAIAYGEDAPSTHRALEVFSDAVRDAEKDFALELLNPDEAVQRAMARGEPGRPVVLADTQDNPGAGGNGDTTGLLRALVRHRAEQAVLGLLIDPDSAARAHAAGQGNSLEFALGGRSAIPADSPFTGRFRVERLGDGRCSQRPRPAFESFSHPRNARPRISKCSVISAWTPFGRLLWRSRARFISGPIFNRSLAKSSWCARPARRSLIRRILRGPVFDRGFAFVPSALSSTGHEQKPRSRLRHPLVDTEGGWITLPRFTWPFRLRGSSR